MTPASIAAKGAAKSSMIRMLVNLRPSSIRHFFHDLFAGNLLNKTYDRLTTGMVVILPSILFPPLRFLSDKSEKRKVHFIRDLMSSWVGLATFFATRGMSGRVLARSGITHERLRFLMSVTTAVVARTVFQSSIAHNLAEKMYERGLIPGMDKLPGALPLASPQPDEDDDEDARAHPALRPVFSAPSQIAAAPKPPPGIPSAPKTLPETPPKVMPAPGAVSAPAQPLPVYAPLPPVPLPAPTMPPVAMPVRRLYPPPAMGVPFYSMPTWR